MKLLPYFLVAGALTMGTACSSSNEAATGATAGANTNGTGNSGTGAQTQMGTDMNPTPAPDANSGLAPNGAMTSPGATGVTSTSGGIGGSPSGGAGAADAAAFTSTFATMQDPVFLMNAASSNMLEIRAGQMAAQKATNPDVRKFAQMMVSHHMSSTQELKAVAAPLGVQMPTTMMPVHQAMADQLMDKSGKKFDETYMDMMEAAHKMDVAMFEVKSKAAESPSVQAFATKTLPMLRSHYTMADALEKKVD
ncbi:MAG: hypothetical protein JWR44_2553 [Hymenobacter sp.]|jgi:putative membrane protein|nr:hypothetical protein [Hymenobacter sp.]